MKLEDSTDKHTMLEIKANKLISELSSYDSIKKPTKFAHYINNWMTGLMGNMQLARVLSDPSEISECYKIIEFEVNIGEIYRDLLNQSNDLKKKHFELRKDEYVPSSKKLNIYEMIKGNKELVNNLKCEKIKTKYHHITENYLKNYL